MYKKRGSSIAISSIPALSRILSASLPPPPPPSLLAPSPSLSRASSLGGGLAYVIATSSPLGPLRRRWLSTAAQRNDFPPEPNSCPEFAGDRRSDHGGHSNHSYRADAGAAPSWNRDSSGVRGFCAEKNRVLRPEEYQRSNLGEVYGENLNGNGSGVGGGFYQAPDYQVNSDWNNGWRSNGGSVQNPNGNFGQGYQEVSKQNPSFSACHSAVGSGQPYDYGNGRTRNEELYHNPGVHNGESNQKVLQHNPNAASGYQYHNPDRGFQQDPTMCSGYDEIGASSTNQQGFVNGGARGVSEMPIEFYGNKPGGLLQSSAEFGRENLRGLQKNNLLQTGSGYSESSMDSQADLAPTPVGYSEIDGGITKEGTIEELDELCKEGKVKDAVQMLDLLEKKGILADLPRFFQLMQACDDPMYLEEARKVHRHILHASGNLDVGVHNKILDMYFNCGATTDAFQHFENMPGRNLTTWDTMIMGLAKNGLGEDALDVFTQFKQTGLQPDGGLFVTVFYACASLGAIDEGMLHFESMKKDFGITPGMEHYVGIVDMLGRTGYLDEALEFINRMPVEPSTDVWEALMMLSWFNGNLELGDHCAEIVEQLDSSRSSEEAKKGLLPVKAADLAKEKIRKKNNSLESRSRVHEYKAGDRSHPHNDKIYAQLRCLHAQMKEAGYIPETRMVLHDVDQESKEEALIAHSERLALSHGLMTSPPRAEIRIIKNLRSCVDCHNAFKILSSLVGRLIVVRDAKRFHHFQNGRCSCNDYW